MAEKKKVTVDAQAPETSSAGKSSSDDKRLLSAIAYILGVLGIIIYLIEKEDKKVRFDALQATAYGVAVFLVFVGGSLFTTVLAFVFPPLGCLGLVWLLVLFGAFIYALYLAYKAYQGERVEIPVIADLVKKYV